MMLREGRIGLDFIKHPALWAIPDACRAAAFSCFDLRALRRASSAWPPKRLRGTASKEQEPPRMTTLRREQATVLNASNTGTILIFDTTLRDGEQSPGCSMNLEEKLQVRRPA